MFERGGGGRLNRETSQDGPMRLPSIHNSRHVQLLAGGEGKEEKKNKERWRESDME